MRKLLDGEELFVFLLSVLLGTSHCRLQRSNQWKRVDVPRLRVDVKLFVATMRMLRSDRFEKFGSFAVVRFKPRQRLLRSQVTEILCLRILPQNVG